MANYSAVEGSTLTTRDAAIVGRELDRIAKTTGGRLTPGVVVDEASARTSPLHRFFEWDNAKAAKRFRLQQAQHLIRSVTVEIIGDGKPQSMRAFVHIGEDYVASTAAMARPDLREIVLSKAFEELEAWKRRYERFIEFAAVFEAIEKTRKSARKMAA